MSACLIHPTPVFHHDEFDGGIQLLVFRTRNEEVDFGRVLLKSSKWTGGDSGDDGFALEHVAGRSKNYEPTCDEALGLFPENLLAGSVEGEGDTEGDASRGACNSTNVDLQKTSASIDLGKGVG